MRLDRTGGTLVRRCLFTAVVLFFPALASAQEAERAPTQAATVMWNVRVGATVGTATLESGRAEGTLVAADSGLMLGHGDLRQRLPLARIDSLWVRKGRMGTGMAIGGLVSTVALGVLACSSSCAGVLWPGLAILPLPGVLVGGLAGRRMTHWEQRDRQSGG